MTHRRFIAATFAAALLGACTTTPPSVAPVALTNASPEAMVAAIRATATHDDAELAVQPLRDPMVEDLREQAHRLEVQKHYQDAAVALDKALALVPDDPALMQERAETALLLRDYAAAERLARQAYAIGAKVGPLCRRHWATIEQTRLFAGDGAGAASAKSGIDACRVSGPNRF